eukprot:GFUD01005370.1.p1 GENE.GFUD01005370.1~~GFUD01005370.1.p1  ORF type:complete len:807 (+),score=194.31 GFUD01005370.1:211-2631(+)
MSQLYKTKSAPCLVSLQLGENIGQDGEWQRRHRDTKCLTSQMRFNLSLCSQEQEFIKKRDAKVCVGLKSLIEKENELAREKDASFTPSCGSLERTKKMSSAEQESMKSSNETSKSLMTSVSFDGLPEKSSSEQISQEEIPQKPIPKLALITSGGGFRAMIAYSGAYKALQESGILDCIHYAGALSGSSWYLSTLYTHQQFPSPEAAVNIIDELKSCVEKHWQVHLSPPWSSKYLRKIIRKSISGQPVGFTDFFGYLVGEQLLRGRMKSKMSDQGEKIKDGDVAMPLYTCIHVKKNISAKIFQEWYEFTPYEVCIPKYGISVPIEKFGSKFYVGNPVSDHKELPLHYLYGVWGSAFTILFKRLIQEKGRGGQKEILKILSSEEGLKEINQETCTTNEEAKRRESIAHEFKVEIENDLGIESDEEVNILDEESEIEHSETVEDLFLLDGENSERESPKLSSEKLDSIDEAYCGGSEDNIEDDKDKSDENGKDSPVKKNIFKSFTLRPYRSKRRISLSKKFEKLKDNFTKKSNSVDETSEYLDSSDSKAERSSLSLGNSEEYSRVEKYLERALSTNPIDSRAGRAGLIHNPLRGLTPLENFPQENCFSPTKPTDQTDFKGYKEQMKTESKKIYLVDSGLSFNFPFPIMLRPQRGISFYIAFDFSSRATDSTHPFRELLLSEKWAKLHKVKFPSIKEQVKQYIDQPVQECYVFKDIHDCSCPVIVFFPLINKDFRLFSAPGVKRETEEEIKFGDFQLFDNTSDYAIWRFVYPNQSFERLSQMVEFNILNNIHVIRQELREFMERNKKILN